MPKDIISVILDDGYTFQLKPPPGDEMAGYLLIRLALKDGASEYGDGWRVIHPAHRIRKIFIQTEED